MWHGEGREGGTQSGAWQSIFIWLISEAGNVLIC